MRKLTASCFRRRGAGRLVSILTPALIVWACGCAHREGRPSQSREAAAENLPKVTSIISGPAACLLTNQSGFQAEFTLSFNDEPTPSPTATPTGQIFVRGGKILWASTPAKSDSARPGAFTWMWDTTAGRGFVASEALQGYALIGGPVWFTNLQVNNTGAVPPPLAGRRVEEINAVATGSDGLTESFALFRLADATHLPVQIRSLKAAMDFTLTLKKIQAVVPPAEVFLPPEGFTLYDSEPALLSELAARQRGLLGGRPGRVDASGDRLPPRAPAPTPYEPGLPH